jgi:chaperone modulatory protein CbpM
MIRIEEFLTRVRLDAESLEAWVAEGWISRRDAAEGFAEVDVARACLIRDLREELGVNDEGVAVALDLLDQLHGLRLALRRVTACFNGLPEPLRQAALAQLRDAGDPGGPGGGEA